MSKINDYSKQYYESLRMDKAFIKFLQGTFEEDKDKQFLGIDGNVLNTNIEIKGRSKEYTDIEDILIEEYTYIYNKHVVVDMLIRNPHEIYQLPSENEGWLKKGQLTQVLVYMIPIKNRICFPKAVLWECKQFEVHIFSWKKLVEMWCGEKPGKGYFLTKYGRIRKAAFSKKGEKCWWTTNIAIPINEFYEIYEYKDWN